MKHTDITYTDTKTTSSTSSTPGSSSKFESSLDHSIRTSEALQVLMQRAQLMIQLSLLQSQIMEKLGFGPEKMQEWHSALPVSVRNILDNFNEEVENMEKGIEIELSYGSQSK